MRSLVQLCVCVLAFILPVTSAVCGTIYKEKNPFSGKVFLVSIGVNNYSKYKTFASLSTAEMGAVNFRERLKKDSSIKEVIAWNFDSRHSKQDVMNAFDEIAKAAGPNDAFIFFCALQAWGGELYFSDSSTLNSTELFQKSQSVFAIRQLFFLDACQGEVFTGKLKRQLMLRPEEGAMGNLNRIVLGIKGFTYETKEGGFFTLSYTKNPGVKLMDIFRNHSLQIKLLDKLYTELDKMKRGMTIDFFSEKEFYTTVVATGESDTRSSITNTSTSIGSPIKKIRIRKGETLSLVIGGKRFDHFSGLKNTLNDAVSLSNVLEQKYLHKTVLMQDPTFAEFRQMLLTIREGYEFEEGSQFLFFAATHGAKDEHGSGMMIFRDSKMENKFLEKAYSLTSIKKAISQLNATNTLMLIDICHSGTMFDDGSCVKPGAIEIPVTSPVFTTKGTGSPAYKNFLNQKTNIFIGSSNDQEAADGTGDHSPFAAVVLRFLNGNNLPVIDSYHLQQTIQQNVMKEGAISIPLFCTYACKDDGRFLFIQR